LPEGDGAKDIEPLSFPQVGCTTVAFNEKAEEVQFPLQLFGVDGASAHVEPPSVVRS
jgi:hypothetical protein